MNIDDLTGRGLALTDDDVLRAAKILGVSAAKIRTVMAVESNGRGFHPETRRAVILFEPHIFSKLTAGRFDSQAPTISYKKWRTLPYPASQGQRWEQLAAAMALQPTAAIEATSWGLFQLMGFNAKACGFDTPEAFARAMADSEGEQLAAFARFVDGQPAMRAALVSADWAGFARAYNGPSYAQNGYDQKLKAAFARFTAQA